MSEINYNKIIHQAATEILQPNGLFQKGQSRTWIDDNGWFLILVEYQPSNWEKGSYLNVGIHYLWSGQDYLSFDYGGREHECVSCQGEHEAFYNSMLELSRLAMKKVLEYRKFRDISYAKKKITKGHKSSTSDSHQSFYRMMICGLDKDAKAVDYYNKLWKEVKDSELAYEAEYRRQLEAEIAPIISNQQLFQKYVKEQIIRQRAFWRTTSMKKLAMDEEYV